MTEITGKKKRWHKSPKNVPKNYNLIISNPCFELWLLLHQAHPKQPLTIEGCEKELKKLIPNYSKSKYNLDVIAGQVELAINHGKILDQGKDLQAAPSTKVFKLVEKLVEESEV